MTIFVHFYILLGVLMVIYTLLIVIHILVCAIKNILNYLTLYMSQDNINILIIIYIIVRIVSYIYPYIMLEEFLMNYVLNTDPNPMSLSNILNPVNSGGGGTGGNGPPGGQPGGYHPPVENRQDEHEHPYANVPRDNPSVPMDYNEHAQSYANVPRDNPNVPLNYNEVYDLYHRLLESAVPHGRPDPTLREAGLTELELRKVRLNVLDAQPNSTAGKRMRGGSLDTMYNLPNNRVFRAILLNILRPQG